MTDSSDGPGHGDAQDDGRPAGSEHPPAPVDPASGVVESAQPPGRTLLGGSRSKQSTPALPTGGPAEGKPLAGKRAKNTLPGGSPQRGQFWGKVATTAPGIGPKPDVEEGKAPAEEPTVRMELPELADGDRESLADPTTEEIAVDEIEEQPGRPPPPKRAAPPKRPRPPAPKRGDEPPAPAHPPTRPPPPKRDAEVEAPAIPMPTPPPVRPEGVPPSRPAAKPPLRRPRSEPPPLAAAPIAPTAPMPAIPPTAPMPAVTPAVPPTAPMPAVPAAHPADASGTWEPPPPPELPPLSLRIRSVQEVCEAELKLKPDPVRAARLHFTIGSAQTDPTAALRCFHQALAQAPDFLPAIRAARALELERGQVAAAAKLFDAEVRLTENERQRAMLHYVKGCAFLDLQGDHEAARAAFVEAAQLDPQSPTILKALQHAELRAKDWGRLAEALALEANAVDEDPRHRAAVMAKRARLVERRLRRSDDAIEQYQLALALDPTTPSALAELKRLLTAQGRWRELVAALEREASLTRSAKVRTAAFWSIGRIFSERLSSQAEAIAALEQAATQSPKEAMLLEELARLYTEAGDDKGAASALERLAAAVERPLEKLAAFHRLGEIHRRRKPQDAVRWYEAALGVDAAFAPALRALETLYRRLENWPSLARMYLAEAGSAVQSKRRADAYARAAEVLDLHLNRSDEAVEHFAHALALEPGHEGAFKALVRLHTAAQRHHELIELYDRAVDNARREDIAIAYLFKMGSLYEDVLKDMNSASAVYRRIFERQKDNLAAIHALQRTAEMAGRYREVVEALDCEARLERSQERALALELRAAEIVAEHLGDGEGAAARLVSVLKRDPKHVGAIASLGKLYQALGRPEDLLTCYQRELDITAERPSRVALLMSMAELSEAELGRPEAAIACYKQVLELDHSHALAKAALVRLLRARGEHKELAQVLAAELAALTKPAAIAPTALLLGEVYEVHLSKPVDAVAAYRRALDAAPDEQAAVEALERVYAQGAAWKELGEVIQHEAAVVGEPRLALDAKLRAAAIRSDRLGKNDEAIELFAEVIAADPENIAALISLEPLYVEGDNRQALAQLYDQAADVYPVARARVATLIERARLLERGASEGDRDEQRAVLTTILATDPGNLWALAALERLARVSNDRTLLADVDGRYTDALADPSLLSYHFTRMGESLLATNPAATLKAYRTALSHSPDNLTAIRGLANVGSMLGDAATMVDSYRREAEFTRDDHAAADLYVQGAAVLARLGDRAGAIGDAERALARAPDHELAAQWLTALMIRGLQIDVLVERLSQAAHQARDPQRRVALWRQVGELHADHRRDLGAAQAAVRRALACNDKDVETLLQLAALCRRDAQHEEAAQLLTRAVGLDDSVTDAHLELARIYTDHLENPAKARQAVDRVLRDRPDDREALRMLLKLHLAAGDRDKARKASARLLEAAGDDGDMRTWALVEIARVELGAGDSEAAAAALHDAVVIKGSEGDAAKLYRRLAGDKVPWDRYAAALRSHLDAHGKRAPAKAFLELARVQHRRLGRSADAQRTLEEGLTATGNAAEIALERAELLAAVGRAPDATAAFLNLIGRLPFQAEAWRGLTQVQQQQGRPAEAALAAGALALLGVATDVERNLAAERSVRPGNARPGAMGRALLRGISAGNGEEDERVASVFAAVADGLAKAFPVAFEQYGVRKGDRIKARAGHPLRNEVDRLATAFGIEEVDLYITSVPGDVAVELAQPPALMVPGYVAELSEAQRVFLLARPLAAIAAGTHPAFKLGPEEVALVLAATVRRVVPSFEDGQHDHERLVVLQDKLSPSWFSRGRVDEVVHRYYAEPVDAARWATTVPLTATRAAALIAGDLEGCLTALRRAGVVRPDTPLTESPLLVDLMRFWMSEPALEARRLAGLL
jgi:tetratricopeptide (TPR) repeat protein